MTIMIIKNPVNEDIISKVAILHQENIRTGFLSSLGDDFLRCVYRSISLSRDSILIVYIEDAKVVGFVSGTLNIVEIKNILKKKCFFIFVKLALKLVFNPVKLKKFLEIYRYSSNNKNDLPLNINAELLSIVVLPDYRKKGIARRLYMELVKFFNERGVKEFKIIVGEKLNDAQNFYEKMGAKKIVEFELHKGKKSYVYLHRVNR